MHPLLGLTLLVSQTTLSVEETFLPVDTQAYQVRVAHPLPTDWDLGFRLMSLRHMSATWKNGWNSQGVQAACWNTQPQDAGSASSTWSTTTTGMV